MKLNIGCKNDLRKDYINIDFKDFGQELIRDVTRGLPFSDETVDEIYTSHFFEHLENKDVSFVLDECVRVLKKGGRLIIIVPHSDTPFAFYFGHFSYWNEANVRDEVSKRPLEFESLDRVGIELQAVMTKK